MKYRITRYRSSLRRILPFVTGHLLLLAMILLFAVPVSAASGAPKVESVEYKGKNKIEVEFKGKVKYKKPSVKVTDADGKVYTAYVIEKDNDDITFKVKNLKKGKTYTFKISNVKKKGADKFTSVKGSFRIAKKGEICLEEVNYDREDREVSFEFQNSVKWKHPTVTIKDSKGNNYVKKILEKDRDEIEVRVKSLKAGQTYTYKITGVAGKGNKTYQVITGSFVP